MIKTTDVLATEGIIDEKALDILLEKAGCSKEKLLLIDIETTGLSPKNSDIYLVGTGYFRDGSWHIDQFMAENTAGEEEILSAFSDLSRGFTHLLHFNGDRFDIPFMRNKYEEHKLSDPFEKMTSLDIYKIVKPYKIPLGLPDCKQKTVELFLGIDRRDKYNGGELVSIYDDFAESGDKKLLEILLLHNYDDVKGMFRLLPMLYFDKFFKMFANMPGISVRTDEEIEEDKYMNEQNLPLRAVKVQANRYRDYDGKDRSEVYMKLRLPFELPSSISGNDSGCFFKASGDEATLKVPLYETELKYYYSNYKDYYYLPAEDMAIHKSLATFVDKDHREKAKPENCYTKKEGQYLREWDLVFAPFFKTDYKDKDFFFDLNENMKKSRFAMSLYGCHVVAHILDT